MLFKGLFTLTTRPHHLHPASTAKLEEDRQRREAEKAALNAKLQETHALNVRLAIIAREKRAAARRAREKASRKKAAVNPLQALWDANGAAIYAANQAFKTKYGRNMSAKVRRKAIKDATRNGHFNAGAYAGNLVKAVTPPPPKKKNPYARAADRIRAAADEIDDEKKIGYQDAKQQIASYMPGSLIRATGFPLAAITGSTTYPYRGGWYDLSKHAWVTNNYDDSSGYISFDGGWSNPEYMLWNTLRHGSACTACHVTHDGYMDNGQIPTNSELDHELITYYRSQDEKSSFIHMAALYYAGYVGEEIVRLSHLRKTGYIVLDADDFAKNAASWGKGQAFVTDETVLALAQQESTAAGVNNVLGTTFKDGANLQVVQIDYIYNYYPKFPTSGNPQWVSGGYTIGGAPEMVISPLDIRSFLNLPLFGP